MSPASSLPDGNSASLLPSAAENRNINPSTCRSSRRRIIFVPRSVQFQQICSRLRPCSAFFHFHVSPATYQPLSLLHSQKLALASKISSISSPCQNNPFTPRSPISHKLPHSSSTLQQPAAHASSLPAPLAGEPPPFLQNFFRPSPLSRSSSALPQAAALPFVVHYLAHHPQQLPPVGAIIVYTYVFQMLAPPNGETFDSDEAKELPNKDAAAYEKLPSKASLPKVEKRSTKVSFKDETPERVPLSPSVESEMVSSTSRKVFANILFVLEELKQPPIIASALAIFCGTIPFLKGLILKDDAPFFFLTDSCLILGEAMIPCILLALGGNLIDGPGVGSRRLGFRTMTAIVFARLVLIPPVGLGIVTLVDKLGLIPNGDKMFKFVLLLQHSMPTSVISGAVANLQGCGKEAAAVLFWVHIFAVFSMAGWIILYLAILF